MARTRAQIETHVNRLADAEPLLDTLQSNTSAASVWASQKNMLITAIQDMEQLSDEAKRQAFASISDIQFGSLAYYGGALDSLEVSYELTTGDTISTESFTLGQFVVGEHLTTPGKIYIYALKDDGEPLGADEIQHLADRLKNDIMPMGIFPVVNNSAIIHTQLKIWVKLFKDVVDTEAIKASIDEATKAFFDSIHITGIIYMSSLEDQIQKIDGVISVNAEVNKLYNPEISPQTDPPTAQVEIMGGAFDAIYDDEYECLNSKDETEIAGVSIDLPNGVFRYISINHDTIPSIINTTK